MIFFSVCFLKKQFLNWFKLIIKMINKAKMNSRPLKLKNIELRPYLFIVTVELLIRNSPPIAEKIGRMDQIDN